MQPSWAVEKIGSNTIAVTFRGRIDTPAGEDSVGEVLQLMGDDVCDLVFDVVGVAGYESGARKAWQSVLWPRRKQIRSMRVISQSALTRMGAAMFARVLAIPCVVEKPSSSSAA